MNKGQRILREKMKRLLNTIKKNSMNGFFFGFTVIGLLLILYYLVFARSIFSRKYLMGGDSYNMMSLKYFILSSIKQFHSLSWWDPTSYNGYPLYYHFLSGYSNYLSPYYLPSLLIFKILTIFTDITINTYIIFHRTLYVISLNMIAIYLIARELVIHRLAAILPVLIFSFSYFQIMNFHDYLILEAMIAPLFYLFALIRYSNTRTCGNLLLLFLFLGLLVADLHLGTMMSAVFWSSIFTVLLILFHKSLIKDTYQLLSELMKTKRGIILLSIAVCLLLSGFFAIWQAPHYNAGHVLRYRGGEVDYDSAGEFTNETIPIETSEIWTVLFNWIPFPEIHDHFLRFAWVGHDNRYIGLVTIPLILAALIFGLKNRYTYILFLTYFLCNGFIIYTTNNIVYRILMENSALFQNMRNMLTFFPRGGPPLFLIFLAGMGLDRLLSTSSSPLKMSDIKTKRLLERLFNTSLLCIIIAGALLLLVGVITYPRLKYTLTHTGISLIIFSFLCKILWTSDQQLIKRQLAMVLFLLTFTDLTISAFSRIDETTGNPFGVKYTALQYHGRIPYHEFAERNMIITDETKFKPVRSEAESMFPENYVGSYHNPWELNWGIKEWLVLATRSEGQRFLRNWNAERIRMTKYPDFLFFTNGYYVPFEKINELGTDLSIVSYEPLFLLHDAQLVSSKKTPPQMMIGEYKIQKYTPNTVEIKTTTEQDGFLHFLDNYARFWSAYIDGRKVPIYRSNFTFKAIELPAGEHIVSWVYNPYPIKIAYGLFYLVLVIFLILSYKFNRLQEEKCRRRGKKEENVKTKNEVQLV